MTSNRVSNLRFFLTLTLILFAGSAIFAGGAREVATKVVLTAPIAYISPTSSIAEKKSLVLSDIKLQIDKNGVIKKYEFAVYDKKGSVIFMTSKENLQGRGFLGDVFNVGDIPSVTLPTKIEWPATNTDGTQVADGEYSYQLTATDNWGFAASSAPLTVVVDTKAPQIQTLSLRQNVISPDGDGKNDVLIVRHLTSAAATWTEQILDASGQIVWTKDSAASGDSELSDIQMPETTEWDANKDRKDVSTRLGEGTYTYKLNGLDRAGNLVTQSTPFKVSYSGADIGLDTKDSVMAFNPNNPMTFIPSLATQTGATKWKLEIKDTQGVIWKRFAGQGPAPESVTFDGTGSARDPEGQGDRLRDGIYLANLTQDYDSGVSVSSPDVSIRVDTTGPKATLKLRSSPKEGSANQAVWFGGSMRGALHFSASTEHGPAWSVEFLPADSLHNKAFRVSLDLLSKRGTNTVTTMGNSSQTDSTDLDWQGFIPEGANTLDFNPSNGLISNPIPVSEPTALPDGQWYVRLSAHDEAGNEGRSTALILVKSTATHGGETVTDNATVIRPGLSDGPNELGLTLGNTKMADIESINLDVVSETGESIFSRKFSADQALAWQGQKTNGLPAPDGSYTPKVTIAYLNGDESKLVADSVGVQGKMPRTTVVDGGNFDTIPEIKVTSKLLYDNSRPTDAAVTFDISGLPQVEKPWSLRIVNGVGTTLWTKASSDAAAPHISGGNLSVSWSATSTAGALLPGAEEYQAILSVSNTDGSQLGSVKTSFITGIPYTMEGAKLRIALPEVLFDGNNPNPFGGTAQQRDSNRRILRQIGTVLARLPDYDISVAGYATYTNGLTPDSMQREQVSELIPLSAQRAERVREALYVLNVDWDRLVPQAKGGVDPVAPYDDLQNRWKNRRVVFLLTKRNQ